VRIADVDVLAEPLRVHPLIGYMSDFFSLYDDMLVWEYLDHFARCYGVTRRTKEGFVEDLLRLVGLDVSRDTLIKTLSRGMRQRLFLAKTLLHQPRVLLLDEPASGLDPAARLEFRGLLKQLHAMGHTIVISSHILTEMTDFCTSIGILEQGRLLASGRVTDILRQLDTGLPLEIEVLTDANRLVELLGDQADVSDISVDEGRVRCRWNAGREGLPELHRIVVMSGVPVVSFTVKEDNLEGIYMRIARHQTA
jgi:ABC-2 type transport system ATP-binding protein